MTDRREELLQARVDGELTSDQRRELERLLAEDASTRLRAGELDALVRGAQRAGAGGSAGAGHARGNGSRQTQRARGVARISERQRQEA